VSASTLASRVIRRLRAGAGRHGEVAPNLPLGLALSVVREKATDLARGVFRTQTLAFVGRRVRMRGKRHVRFGRWSVVGAYSVLDGYSSHGVELGSASRIGSNCVVTVTSHLGRMGKGFSLGARSGLGDFCHVGASGGVRIEDDVICGSYVSFHSQEHVFADPDLPIREQGVTEAGIVVGAGTWIGARVTVLDGTSIGERCVVAAGAVVKGDFPARSLIGGVPARVLRSL
jgi:acetyltransferase-like isoleucine patch superfamily enzyme